MINRYNLSFLLIALAIFVFFSGCAHNTSQTTSPTAIDPSFWNRNGTLLIQQSKSSYSLQWRMWHSKDFGKLYFQILGPFSFVIAEFIRDGNHYWFIDHNKKKYWHLTELDTFNFYESWVTPSMILNPIVQWLQVPDYQKGLIDCPPQWQCNVQIQDDKSIRINFKNWSMTWQFKQAIKDPNFRWESIVIPTWYQKSN